MDQCEKRFREVGSSIDLGAFMTTLPTSKKTHLHSFAGLVEDCGHSIPNVVSAGEEGRVPQRLG